MSFFRYGLIWAACLQMLDPVYSPKVHVKPGKDVTLPCQGHNPIELLKWTKQDLYMYVFFHRDNRSYEIYQNLSFRGRVQLRDPEMKDGDVSIIIRNVTINDTGRYECSTAEKNIGTTPKLNHIVDLKVDSAADPQQCCGGNSRVDSIKDERGSEMETPGLKETRMKT
ncbi:hyaluronan and proteoglycan link protein 4-like isoform X2 [Thunnus maccoyii]|uniref:hyaluronan and proteoglycan link protein 4-like isoform X2 n=1 Tax=Thunnus maccoyii TaxID=8240 RepID=UPI001C4BC77D|nr:hyaluronan and proteoglycan link protein 4-like isoform X2 [Thunnus maccoyii]